MGMTIGEIEKFIKSRKDEQIIVSPRVETKLKERGLDCKIIKEKLLNNNILGIVNQGGEVYKTWIEYNSHQDLNIILRIREIECCIVTAFPCESERRIRHEDVRREKG